ncbi:MAG: uroporphyrinogen decarboxylase family protein [Armatimonadota bacterium]
MGMTSRERFVGVLTGQPVDRVPFMKIFGGTNATLQPWEGEYPGLSSCIDEILQFEGAYRGWATTPVNFWLSQCGEAVMLEETAEHIIWRGGEGTVSRQVKGGDYHGQTLEWPVKERADWERMKARYLQADDPERFPAEWPALVNSYQGREYPLQLTHGGVYGFARNIMGDVNLSYAFYDDPALVHDIMGTYTDMMLALWTRMVADVDFDLIEFWEDMASKNGCLISPRLFNEFMAPQYRRVRDFARRHQIPIMLVDSDGNINALAHLMHDAGVTAMYPFEVQAGCDCATTRRALPALGIIGGLDKEAMARGPQAIDREMERARQLIRLGRCIPGPDHFVLSNVSWESYRYFMESLREVVLTTPVDAALLSGNG